MVFCREFVARLGQPSCGIPGSPTGHEDLTLDIVPQWVISGDQYPLVDARKVGCLLALPQIMHP